MRHSVALSTVIHGEAAAHLIRRDGQEDLCFATWYPSTGETRRSALLHELILPRPGERAVHGNVAFEPAYFERAVGRAVDQKAGLALMHSHLGPGWQGMSPDDIAAEENHAAPTKGATGLPLLGMTIGTDGAWSGRFWEKVGRREYKREWCETTRVVGDRMSVTFNDSLLPPVAIGREQLRTASAWGPEIQAAIARLRIGIAGAGSVGSIVAESLARMGVSRVLLLDFDSIEDLNLDRLLHATRRDVGSSKVSVLAKAIRRSATAPKFQVIPMEFGVTEQDGFRAALDCDLLFSCVDRPWPRHVLNFIAYAHLIPVIDGGVLVTSRGGRALRHADMRGHMAAPGRRCLQCLGQYDAGHASVERDGYLDKPSYIRGLPEGHALKRNENVFAFAQMAAALEVLQMLSAVVGPSGIGNVGAQMYHFVTGQIDIENAPACDANCAFRKLEGMGDHSGLEVTGRHLAAERSRQSRRTVSARLRRTLRRFGLNA